VAQIAFLLSLLSLFLSKNNMLQASLPAPNRYSVLQDTDFGTEPDTADWQSKHTALPNELAGMPWEPTAFDANESSWQNTLACTPLPALTPVSPMRYLPQQEHFEFNDTVYSTLSAVIHASGAANGIPAHLIHWLGTVAEVITQYHVAAVQNLVAEKFNKHIWTTAEQLNGMQSNVKIVTAHQDSLHCHINNHIDWYNTATDTFNNEIEHINTMFQEMDNKLDNLMLIIDNINAENGSLVTAHQSLIKCQEHIKRLNVKLRDMMACKYMPTAPLTMDWSKTLAPKRDWANTWGQSTPPPAPLGNTPPQPAAAPTPAAPAPTPAWTLPPGFVYNLTVPLVAAQAPLAPAALAPCPCIADPPKFLGNTKDMMLEEWLQKIGLWLCNSNIVTDNDKIAHTLQHLEKGVAQYMDQYYKAAITGQPLGGWANFVAALHTAYTELNPKKNAQQHLDKVCNHKHSSLAKFAEEFQIYAHCSGYLDKELILCIDAQRPANVLAAIVNMSLTNLTAILTNWQGYLELLLNIKMKFRQEKPVPKGTTTTTVNVIKDTNKKQLLNAEQIAWCKEGLCFKCSKHLCVPGQGCQAPRYKGLFNVPKEYLDLFQKNVEKACKKCCCGAELLQILTTQAVKLQV
jgi:flagellar biosynthesis chaperone FliJ